VSSGESRLSVSIEGSTRNKSSPFEWVALGCSHARRQGYKRGKRKGVYRLSAAKAVLRDDYVLKMAVDPDFRGRRKVYIDESYIHHNYSRHQDSLYDPTDPNSTVERHKGRRYCFIAAIIDGDPNSDGEGELLHELEPSECDKELDRVLGVPFPANSQELSTYSQGMAIHPGKSQLLMDTFKFFEGSKQTKDYHGMFNHDYFVAWMDKLLRALERRGIRNCVIVMDNAKYHKKLPVDVPRKKDAKAIILQACKNYGLPGTEADTKEVLWGRVQAYVEKNIPPVIVKMATDAGHSVVFTPPHFSDLL
jgi:hypothetical protein